jgi:subtilisin family serine protease
MRLCDKYVFNRTEYFVLLPSLVTNNAARKVLIYMKKTLVAASYTFLVACGGGGGAAFQYDFTEGTPSSEANADSERASNAASSLPYEDVNGNSYTSLNDANNSLNNDGDYVATTDTGARTAWQQGWTGRGVKVGIADDFNSNGRLDEHGDWVAIIAGSVAPEADYNFIDMLGFSAAMTPDQALNYFENNGYHIINASWGIDRYDQNTGVEYTSFDADVASLVNSFDQSAEDGKQALIVYAAGNSGYVCSGKRSENCSLQQAVVSELRNAGYTSGEKSIFVGSLADGSSEIAGYSIIAGDLKNDFIVAHDDILTFGDGVGTSFSAPRVAGAAAVVRHKFPNLTSDQLKQVILQTADDLGTAGVDDVYGHGKLSLVNALSPVGTVVPR